MKELHKMTTDVSTVYVCGICITHREMARETK